MSKEGERVRNFAPLLCGQCFDLKIPLNYRFMTLRDQVERAAMSTGVILLAFSNISGYVIPVHAQGLKITIKKHIDILLQDFNDDTDLLKILPNVALQVVQVS